MLEGIRVVVIGSGTPVSTFASLLGDQGCDVIRVEAPQSGDPGRRRGDLVDGGSLEWAVAARSCRGVTCDPATTDGRALLVRLLSTADVVGEGCGPGALERLGLGPDALRGPTVVVRFSGRARATDRGGDDIGDGSDAPELVALAEGGMLALTGQPDAMPVPLGVRYAEQLAGISGASAALAALLAGIAPGDAPVIAEVATTSAVLRVTEWTVPAFDRLGTERTREGNRPSSVAPLDVYLSADDHYLAIVGGSDANFARLVRGMDHVDLLTDPRYATAAARVERSDEINDLVARWVRDRTADEVERRCAASGTPVGRVARASELLDDPHFVARGDFVTVDDPAVGAHRQPAPHPRFDGERTTPVCAAPALGQHNREIWCDELGVEVRDLEALLGRGVL